MIISNTKKLFITASSPNPQPAYIMTSAAGNLANTLGLHRRLDGFGLTPEEIEERRNVFWVFYLMEKEISRDLGRPSVINDDDIAVDLPPKKPGLIRSPSGAKVYDVFQDQIMLAIIGSRTYSELYSASSQTKLEMDRMKVLGKLDNHLQRWRDAMPIHIRPEHPINCSDEQYVSVVMMHFTYLDAVIRLHRMSVHQESFKDSEAADMKSHNQRRRLNPRVYASQLLCLAAARRSVQLLDTFNNNNLQNQHLMWFVNLWFCRLVILTRPQEGTLLPTQREPRSLREYSLKPTRRACGLRHPLNECDYFVHHSLCPTRDLLCQHSDPANLQRAPQYCHTPCCKSTSTK